MSNAPFIDWITVRQSFAVEEPLPLLFRGVHSYHTSDGRCVSERLCAQSIRGSWDTAVAVQCDGANLLVSGNVGRFGRADNVFNYRWRETIEALERVLDALSLPRFSLVDHTRRNAHSAGKTLPAGALLSTVDVTRNYSAGSDAQAIAFIRHCSNLNVSRCKRGLAGDESVWWSNSRRMLKVYRKGPEMVAHGADPKSKLVQWCFDMGIVRPEVSMKRRLLSDLGLTSLGAVTDERLEQIYNEETAFLSKFDSSDDPDILSNIPPRSRAYAAAWLAGQDLSAFCSRATLYRHARTLSEYGLDIFSPRNVSQFPTKVRIIDLEPVAAPEWYEWEKKDVA